MFYLLDPGILPSVRLADSVIIEPPYVHKRRKADEYILYLIKRGAMYLQENGTPLTLQAGDVCILDPAYTHEGLKSSWCEYFYIHFRHPSIQRIDESRTEDFQKLLLEKRRSSIQSNIFSYEKCGGEMLYLPKRYHMSDYGSLVRVTELFHEAIGKNTRQLEHYKIQLACKVLEAFTEIARSYVTTETVRYMETQPRSCRMVQNLLHYLNREYASDITGELLEKEFGGNFDYMNRVFRKTTGETIFRYLNRVRINHAKALILNSPWKMSVIGSRVGFSDEYYFSRVFKKYTGKSPTEYAREGMNARGG